MNYAVIMAGGSGVRLWPLSRRHLPKQILNLFDEKSLLQHCVERLRGIFDPEAIYVVTNAEYTDSVAKHLPEIPPTQILSEPVGRDTANAIGLAATVIGLKDPQGTMAVFSADQIIEPHQPLHEALQRALNFLQSHPAALFTFGIKARYAHTGLGYLKRGEGGEDLGEGVFPVEAFKEKPNKNTASNYIRSGNYCWNSGMFVWRIETILRQLEKFLPHNFERLETIGAAWNSEERSKVLGEEFGRLEKISIDYGVMERAAHVYMCELDCQWLDVGSFGVLAETIGNSDANDNVTTEETKHHWINSSNNIAISSCPDHLIAGVNVEDLVIIHTRDATLICHRDETERLKELVGQLQAGELKRFT